MADDDVSVREALSKVLKDAGYEVLLAADGPEALARLGTNRVDLVLLDIGLPKKSGWDIFERITSQDPGLPIIIITGQTGQYATARAAGAGALMEKPLDVDKLLETMRQLTAEPRETRLRRMLGYRHDVRRVRSENT